MRPYDFDIVLDMGFGVVELTETIPMRRGEAKNMFEKSKGRYLTRGVDAEIPIALQVMMWQAVDQMPQPKDYLQVFRLSEKNGLQIVHHTSEQPQFEMTYIAETEKPVTAKVYIIDDGEHCTMLLAEEY